jgi:1-aminocyclopropane-1-carboxylate deaminase/D-cysteine desulfhydrase-like pyridoxal-dependent ACC family enzyme
MPAAKIKSVGCIYIFTLKFKNLLVGKNKANQQFKIKMLFDTTHIRMDELNAPEFKEKNIKLTVARLDTIHPVVSGNKLFKLHYFLEEAMVHKRPLVTFGGAYSNHLAATAYACRALGLSGTGIVRGEKPAKLSPTLQRCVEYGMKLLFVPRELYGAVSTQMDIDTLPAIDADSLVIPEGGYHPTGARGAAMIADLTAGAGADYIVTAVGTATTLAGLLQKATQLQQVIAIPVLKNFTDINERLLYLNGQGGYKNLHIWDKYHFGGYAKKTTELIHFMNEISGQFGLPTDFVYTAKMLFAVIDMIKNNFFLPGCKILCLHTGGLQGNQSLPAGSLIF